MRLLVVEDERDLAQTLRRALEEEEFAVDLAEDGEEGLFKIRETPYDAVILDLMLPRLDGWSVLEAARAGGIRTPVLVLTARDMIEDRVRGLNLGADDYLPKPFAFAELIARIRALGRRPAGAIEGRLTAGDLGLDELRHVAQVGDRTVDLSAREFALLGYLIRHAGQVVTRQQILDAVWGAEPDVYSNVVDLYVHYLRRKLGELGRADRLRTVRGVGYMLRAEA